MRQYIALIHKEADSDYGVSFPDLPGVISAGKTLDEARDMGAEALALHLEGLAADGDAAPEPRSLEEVMKDAQNNEGVAVLIAALEACGILAKRRLVVRCAIDVVEDRAGQPLLSQLAEIVEVVAVAQTHVVPRRRFNPWPQPMALLAEPLAEP
jgi:predicted RNase H-like HicB family nuclease